MNAIYCDTREKPQAIESLSEQIKKKGYELVRTKLYVGDYQLLSNPYLVVDRKQNLQEIIGNVTHDHKRFKADVEFQFCAKNQTGNKIVEILEKGAVEHGKASEI